MAKVLVRIQGPSGAPEDDELVEAKHAQTFTGVRCLQVPESSQVARRVTLDAMQLGRLKYGVLVAGPPLMIPAMEGEGQ